MEKSYVRLEGTVLEPARLRKLRVGLVGLGALGSEIAKCLGLAGAGEVLLVDPDTVEASNLTRGLFYQGAVGRAKAEALAEAAGRFFPDTRWTPVPAEIADVGWGRLRGLDLLFGAVDRDAARLEMARIGTRLGLPVCDGGLATQGGGRRRVSWFPGDSGAACFGCRLTAGRRRELLSTWRSSAHPCGAPGPEPGGWSSTPTLASITGAWQVEAAMRALAEPEREAFSLEIEVAPKAGCQRLALTVNAACPFHEPAPELIAAGAGRFGEWMRTPSIGWEWAVCVQAECLACGRRWNPACRAARFLREGRCPACGAARVRIDRATRTVRRDSPEAQLEPTALGLPADHLYTVGT